MAAAAIDADAETDAAVPQGWEKRVECSRKSSPRQTQQMSWLPWVRSRHVGTSTRQDVLKASIEPKRKAKALARASAEMQQCAACLEEAWRELIAGAQDEGACMRQITEQEASGQCPTRHKFDAIDYKILAHQSQAPRASSHALGSVRMKSIEAFKRAQSTATCTMANCSGLPCGFGYMSYGAPGYHHEYKDGVFAEEYEGGLGNTACLNAMLAATTLLR